MPVNGMRARIAARLLLATLCLVALGLIAGTSATLELAPAVLLVVPLLLGRYPGERLIRRLAGRMTPTPVAYSIVIPRAPRSLGPRIAALAIPGAGRAPPAGALI
ncbi:MAG TPA: hypothetical protein VIH71_18355 [Solirubrobacteraceae bacterium]